MQPSSDQSVPNTGPNQSPLSSFKWLDAWQKQCMPSTQAKSTLSPLSEFLDPQYCQQIQMEFNQQAQVVYAKYLKGELSPIHDRRFAASAWHEQPSANLMANLYLLASQSMTKLAEHGQTDSALQERISFAVMQFIDAFSPANFLALNPDAQKLIVDTQGKSLAAGLANLFQDLNKGRITQTDETQFAVGKNLAITSGGVVFENDVMQLLQYHASTQQIFERPILLVPPCINKYYILDLQAHNSLVKYLVDQGHQVFMISWRNPVMSDPEPMDTKTWDDYVQQGVLQSIDVIQSISKQKKINALGFCIGGTLLSTAVAIDKTRGQDRIQSMTLLTTLLDFSDTGTLGMFVDDTHIKYRQETLGQRGILNGAELASTFSFLRPNELVWNYVVANYLKGHQPPPFDLLYWNSDSTNLPGPFYVWYLENTYHKNRLKKKHGVQIGGVPLDLKALDMPMYFYASRDDHIVPCQSVFKGVRLVSGKTRYVLGASGHIAGVINPPAQGKRSYWVAPTHVKLQRFDDWFSKTTEIKGSWWPDWVQWLNEYAGRQKKASSVLGNAQFSVIEPSPGRFVMVKTN